MELSAESGASGIPQNPHRKGLRIPDEPAIAQVIYQLLRHKTLAASLRSLSQWNWRQDEFQPNNQGLQT